MNHPPKRRTRKASISSFGPEIMAALLQGSKRRVDLKLPYRTAIQFRRRVHELRSRMREV